jgi:phosphoribosylamine--glycine ligase
MVTDEGPRVLEFNCRFGDPEAQLLMPLLASGLRDAADAVLAGRIDRWAPRWHEGSTVCVTLCAPGYPEQPRMGMPIDGIERAAALGGVLVFHAGTALRDGRLVVSGGRVLNVVGTGATLAEARERAYRGAEAITFEGKTFRRDIAAGAAFAADEAGGSRRAELREVTQA